MAVREVSAAQLVLMVAQHARSQEHAVLDRGAVYTMKSDWLTVINKLLRMHDATGKVAEELDFLNHYFGQVASLKLAAGHQYHYSNDTFDLSPFRSLRSLVLLRISPDRVTGLERLRGQLQSLTVRQAAVDPHCLFSSCGGDQTTTEASWKSLRVVDLQQTALSNVHGFLHLTPSVRILNLSDNKVAHLSEDVRSLQGLETLDVSFNQLETLKCFLHVDVPTALRGLCILDIRNNRLQSLLGIETLMGLEELHAENNSIFDWDELRRLQHLEHLRWLWLEGNPLMLMDEARTRVLAHFPHCWERIHVDGKPTTSLEASVVRATLQDEDASVGWQKPESSEPESPLSERHPASASRPVPTPGSSFRKNRSHQPDIVSPPDAIVVPPPTTSGKKKKKKKRSKKNKSQMLLEEQDDLHAKVNEIWQTGGRQAHAIYEAWANRIGDEHVSASVPRIPTNCSVDDVLALNGRRSLSTSGFHEEPAVAGDGDEEVFHPPVTSTPLKVPLITRGPEEFYGDNSQQQHHLHPNGRGSQREQYHPVSASAPSFGAAAMHAIGSGAYGHGADDIGLGGASLYDAVANGLLLGNGHATQAQNGGTAAGATLRTVGETDLLTWSEKPAVPEDAAGRSTSRALFEETPVLDDSIKLMDGIEPLESRPGSQSVSPALNVAPATAAVTTTDQGRAPGPGSPPAIVSSVAEVRHPPSPLSRTSSTRPGMGPTSPQNGTVPTESLYITANGDHIAATSDDNTPTPSPDIRRHADSPSLAAVSKDLPQVEDLPEMENTTEFIVDVVDRTNQTATRLMQVIGSKTILIVDVITGKTIHLFDLNMLHSFALKKVVSSEEHPGGRPTATLVFFYGRRDRRTLECILESDAAGEELEELLNPIVATKQGLGMELTLPKTKCLHCDQEFETPQQRFGNPEKRSCPSCGSTNVVDVFTEIRSNPATPPTDRRESAMSMTPSKRSSVSTLAAEVVTADVKVVVPTPIMPDTVVPDTEVHTEDEEKEEVKGTVPTLPPPEVRRCCDVDNNFQVVLNLEYMGDGEECVGTMDALFLDINPNESQMGSKLLNGTIVLSTHNMLIFWYSTENAAPVLYNTTPWDEMSRVEMLFGRQGLKLRFGEDIEIFLFSGDAHLTREFLHLLALRPKASLCPLSWHDERVVDELYEALDQPPFEFSLQTLSDLHRPGYAEQDRQCEQALGLLFTAAIRVEGSSGLGYLFVTESELHLAKWSLASVSMDLSNEVTSVKQLLFDPQQPCKLGVEFWAEDTLPDLTAASQNDRWQLTFLTARSANEFATILNDLWKPFFHTDLAWSLPDGDG